MELNDQGEYVPVEIQAKTDYKTGGVYMIRQVRSCTCTCIGGTLPLYWGHYWDRLGHVHVHV